MNDKQIMSSGIIILALIALTLLMTVVGLSGENKHLQQEIVKHECASWSYDQKLIWK